MSMTIRVGVQHDAFEGVGTLFDGLSAARYPAQLSIDESEETLCIDAAGKTHRWPLADIRTLKDQADRTALILALDGGDLARLQIDNAETHRLLTARCRNLSKRPRPRGLRRLAVWSVAAIASVALILLVLVPRLADQLAVFLPPDGERALGDTTLTQVRRVLSDDGIEPVAFCLSPDGVAALDTLVARVTNDLDLPHPLSVKVLKLDEINAFALPGGHITFFSGLIDAAETPEEVAAVFAHELGHVVARDPTRLALRSAGSIGVMGLLLGDFAGGAIVLFLVERLVAANYSQTAEAEADAFAAAQLRDANIDPGALGDFFERLQALGGDAPSLLEHFLPHPALLERIEAARNAPEMSSPDPILSAEEWAALKSICASDIPGAPDEEPPT